MRYKALSFVIGVTMLFLTTAYGQSPQNLTPANRAAKLTDWMKTNLLLTEEQLPKVQEINLKYAGQVETLKNSNKSKMQKWDAFKAGDKAKDVELKQIFTESQYTTYQTKKEAFQKQAKEAIKKHRQAG